MINTLHGGDIYSQEILWDFSTNINPLGTPEGVKEALCRSAELCSRYPDIQCRELTAVIAAYHNTIDYHVYNHTINPYIEVEARNILCTNGAADCIYQLAFALRPKYALIPAPSFSEYEHALRAAGCQVGRCLFGKEHGFAIDTKVLMDEAMERKKKGEKPEIIFLCNPNNPTGLLIPKDELESFAAFAEAENIRLVIDECFLDFLEEPEKYSLIPLLKTYPHLVILKAFTKIYGMAGLRLGYGLSADSVLLEAMQRMRQPWSVSIPAQMAGIAALKEKEYVLQAKRIIGEGRVQLSEGLQKRGFFVYPSQANYLFFQDLQESKNIREKDAEKQPSESGNLYRACIGKKLLLRSCADFYGLDNSYYRICIKTKEENEHLLAVLDECSQ